MNTFLKHELFYVANVIKSIPYSYNRLYVSVHATVETIITRKRGKKTADQEGFAREVGARNVQ